MHLRFVRLDDRHYETLITRRDGVSFHVKGIGHMFAIPHDLAHLAIEQSLGLTHGFWGSVADGAVFDSLTHVSGRRKPHAAERSHAVLKANAPAIRDAEVLVAIFNQALEAGHGPSSPYLRDMLTHEVWTLPGQSPRRLTDGEIEAACSAWQRMRGRWRELPIGGTLEFEWSADAPAKRPRRIRRRSGRSARGRRSLGSP